MSRHSKNNCAGAVFTYAERQKLSYGTQKQRLGKDSLRQWDACGLCLHALVEPLICPKGHMFCKECIYEALLTQKQELKKKLADWELAERRRKEEEDEKQAAAQQRDLAQFERTDGGLLPQQAKTFLAVANPSIKPAFVADGREVFTAADGRTVRLDAEYRDVEDKRAQFEAMTAVRRLAEHEKGLKPSFWVPSNTPTAPAAPAPRPSEETQCVEGPHPLRLKQLVRVVLTPAKSSGEGDSAVYRPGMYECPVCRKTVTNAMRAGVLAACGHLLCMHCITNYVLAEHKCFVCTKPCREKDLIRVAEGATGYSAHGEKLESQKTTPTAWL